MENPTYIALSRLDAQQRTMDVIAANMANANTAGYKAEHVLFSDYMVRQRGAHTAPGGEALSFTQDRSTYRDQSAGALTQTGNPLGPGPRQQRVFLGADTQRNQTDSVRAFRAPGDGTVADASGNALLDTGGNPIQLPAGRKPHPDRS